MAEPICAVVVYAFKASTPEAAMWDLLREHRATLAAERLTTTREPWILQSYANSREVLEIFEWVDETAGRAAPQNPKVLAVWAKAASLCDSVGASLAKTAEVNAPFAHFRSVRI